MSGAPGNPAHRTAIPAMIDRARLESIVRKAGEMALAGWPGDGHALEVWEKKPGDPVSEADLAVNEYLKRELTALLPAAGWLSEETTDAPHRMEGTLVWLVDPIDGTRDYIRGREGWAISVALVSARRPLLGYLFAPSRRREEQGEFWHGESGKGSWRNGRRLSASTRQQLVGARMPLGSGVTDVPDFTRVPQPNSIALRMAMVASDEADIVATMKWGFEWDLAAAALIAREAGATVTDVFGEPLNYNKRNPRAFGVLATSPAIHAAAVERLAEMAREVAAKTG
jgi:myo-inositol-1(or 4)-monophosphatase